jgi:hypothetical protein
MNLESPQKGTEKTSITLSRCLRAGLIRSLISELSTREQIAVLQETLMEVSNPKHLNANERKRNEWLGM